MHFVGFSLLGKQHEVWGGEMLGGNRRGCGRGVDAIKTGGDDDVAFISLSFPIWSFKKKQAPIETLDLWLLGLGFFHRSGGRREIGLSWQWESANPVRNANLDEAKGALRTELDFADLGRSHGRMEPSSWTAGEMALGTVQLVTRLIGARKAAIPSSLVQL